MVLYQRDFSWKCVDSISVFCYMQSPLYTSWLNVMNQLIRKKQTWKSLWKLRNLGNNHEDNKNTNTHHKYVSGFLRYLFLNTAVEITLKFDPSFVPKFFCQHSIFCLVAAAVSCLVKIDIISLAVLEKIRFAPSVHTWELSSRQSWRQHQICIYCTTNTAHLYHHYHSSRQQLLIFT